MEIKRRVIRTDLAIDGPPPDVTSAKALWPIDLVDGVISDFLSFFDGFSQCGHAEDATTNGSDAFAIRLSPSMKNDDVIAGLRVIDPSDHRPFLVGARVPFGRHYDGQRGFVGPLEINLIELALGRCQQHFQGVRA